MTDVMQLPLDVVAIQKLLPHRYPFLLVDRVVEFEPHKRVLCYKNVSCNEPFFQGHFLGHPVMPGVLVLEALAQAGGILTQLSHQSGTEGKRNMALYAAIARVDGEQVACADILCAEVKA